MQTSYEMFLLAAEETSFTKAANKAYITQQCLSSHIKRLEDQYGVSLFNRTPKLTLTPAGELLLQSLRQIQVIEKGIENELLNTKEGIQGSLILGINATRARILLADLFAEFHKSFPYVRLSVVLDDVKRLLPLLLNGKLDLFLGVNCPSHELLKRTFLRNERIYMIATHHLLTQYGEIPKADPATGKRRIRLSDFPCLPFVGNNSNSTFNQLIERYLNNLNVQLNMIFFISDYETQLQLCARHLAAAFCPEIVLEKAAACNRGRAEEDQIRIFELDDLNDTLKIELVTHVHAHFPLYMREFIDLLGTTVHPITSEQHKDQCRSFQNHSSDIPQNLL